MEYAAILMLLKKRRKPKRTINEGLKTIFPIASRNGDVNQPVQRPERKKVRYQPHNIDTLMDTNHTNTVKKNPEEIEMKEKSEKLKCRTLSRKLTEMEMASDGLVSEDKDEECEKSSKQDVCSNNEPEVSMKIRIPSISNICSQTQVLFLSLMH